MAFNEIFREIEAEVEEDYYSVLGCSETSTVLLLLRADFSMFITH